MSPLLLAIVLALSSAVQTTSAPEPPAVSAPRDAPVCRDTASDVHLAGADRVTTVVIPKGWCYEETGSNGVNAHPRGAPGVTLNLDWSRPHRDSVYDDFDARIGEEIRFIRTTNTDVRTRRFSHGGFPAVEVRARQRDGQRIVHTYIGVHARGELGRLFVVMLSGPPTAFPRYLDAYRAIVRSIRIVNADT